MSEQLEPTTPERQEIIPVPTNPERGLVNPFHEKDSWPVVTNIPPDAEHADMLIAVHGPAAGRVSERIGQIIPVQWFYCHYVERVDPQTGEARIEPRLLLFGPDRQAVVTTGVAVREAFGSILRYLGAGPWNPPVHVKISSVPGGNGHKYHVLSYVPPSVAKKGK